MTSDESSGGQTLENHLRQTLSLLKTYRMPFGRFGPKNFPPHGVPVYELPYEYLRYFERRGYPEGRLGALMKFVHDIKRDGAEEIFQPLRRRNGNISLRTRKSERNVKLE